MENVRVWLTKRKLNKLKKNGQKKHVYVLRWRDPRTGKLCCESTGTADKTQADFLQRAKWEALNNPQPEMEPEVEQPRPSWAVCRAALAEAMRADNCRPNYVNDALLMFDTLERMLPGVDSPADVTPAMAQKFKRDRAAGRSAWTLKGDLATLRAVFGKWLGKECELLNQRANPFADVKPPKTDEPEVRIVTPDETRALFDWLADRWPGWKLPLVYLKVAALLGWRASEIASIAESDLLPGGHVQVQGSKCKTRRKKTGWLPPALYAELQACAANGWAFGRYNDELKRQLIVARKQPHIAARVADDFDPARLVGWMQDELARFNDCVAAQAAERGEPKPERFTLHDFRRTCISAMQMAGVSEKEASIQVGVNPETMRKHYEKLEQQTIAKRNMERRMANDEAANMIIGLHSTVRAWFAQGDLGGLDDVHEAAQTRVS